MLNTLEQSEAWRVFQAFVEHNAAVHAGACLYYSQETGRQIEAAASAAKAEVLRSMSKDFMQMLRNKALGDTGVVENPMPEQE